MRDTALIHMMGWIHGLAMLRHQVIQTCSIFPIGRVPRPTMQCELGSTVIMYIICWIISHFEEEEDMGM